MRSAISYLWNLDQRRVSKSLIYVLTLLGLLYTINSDIIIQNSNNLLAPVQSLVRSNSSEKSVSSLTGMHGNLDLQSAISEKRLTYIFVIDISKSVEWEGGKPYWLDNKLETINMGISNICEFSYEGSPTGIFVSKVRVIDLLLQLKNKDVDFAIWTLGSNSTSLYPADGNEAAAADSPNIHSAIKLIHDDIDDHPEANDTDFKNLFLRLPEIYSTTGDIYREHAEPSFVLILSSDLIHHTKNKIMKNLKAGNGQVEARRLQEVIENDKRELLASIAKLSKTNMIANTIIFEEVGNNKVDETEVPLLEHLDYHLGYRLTRTSVREDSAEILYTPVRSVNGIDFYYENPYYISETSSTIRLERAGRYGLQLVPSGIERGFGVDFSYQIIGANDMPKEGRHEFRGKLTPGAQTQWVSNLQKDDAVHITYEGRLFPSYRIPNLKLYMPRETAKAYVFQMHFIKTFPWWSALLLSLLVSAMAVLMFLLAKNLILLIRKDQPPTPEG